MTTKSLTILRHNELEHPGRILKWCELRGIEVQEIYAFQEQSFPTLSGNQKLLLLGGPSNVGDPELEAEQAWLQACLTEGVSVFGICLGAQLLAFALGANITRLKRSELGWINLEMNQLKPDDILKPLSKLDQVFLWHDYLFDQPLGSISLGSSKDCVCQGFEIDRHLGLQFHPEWDQSMLAGFAKHEGWSAALIEQQPNRLVELESALFQCLDKWWAA
ncbi:type 1 glutamine amidotransferase [Alginatibacterium sediminis]|uniref:Type 1 glutamine amidotransferase n=1 Tax=Alginatibacterium sediminis TaxID=2164068 RepID=A0A420EDE3_9ALTE|nr:type 1 glutamine amidotransferase [Alginatibacterium sediminis]RKF18759.1 type 1 glutamine amidotransferase [Alginatibacterium sediminis]